MERHRALRLAFLALRAEGFDRLRCLQFSRDDAIALDWFEKVERSIFGQKNSRDIQALPDADESWDVVVCNHVLEHVPRPDSAVRELARVLTKQGFLVLSYPAPAFREKTDDWGYPDTARHRHYRTFGRDYEAVLRRLLPELIVGAVSVEDPITRVVDLVYLVTRAPHWIDALTAHGFRVRIVSRPGHDAR